LWAKTNSGAFSCVPQFLRFFKGYAPGHPEDWDRPVRAFNIAGFPEPIPGPTLRARVGDRIEITFLNQIQPKHFGASFDRGDKGLGCDTRGTYPGSDTMPNCIHGSSTANLHFHGTHTTPSTTGDNVLVQVRPSLRKYPPEPDGTLLVTEDAVRKPFAEFFQWCEANGSPSKWNQMPRSFREMQMGRSTTSPGGLVGEFDKQKGYERAQLWGPNQEVIQQGAWPTYFVGAYPYCFSLPEYDPTKVKMGQAPGTHWYHAHKHGSTHLNVSSGMTGAFIIEGDYDDVLRRFYKSTDEHKNWDLEEQVLIIQQLSTVSNLLNNGGGQAVLSLNGRQQPIVTARPGQVQLWRFINAAPRNMVTFCPVAGLTWRQTAQDGVQFSPTNYATLGQVNGRIVLPASSRADILVQMPATAEDFIVSVADDVRPPTGGTCGTPLLRVHVEPMLPAAQPSMPLIDEASFPRLPAFLNDIPASDIRLRRELVFATMTNGEPPAPRSAPPGNSHFIDDHQFADQRVDQSMLLDTVEEWKVMNATDESTGIHHPLHIHINPFQVTEVFDPYATGGAGPCGAIDPTNPETWKPCETAKKDFVWRDVFAIPSGKTFKLDVSVCTESSKCPEAIRKFVRCANKVCNVVVPGYFKMRSRFADYTGQYVLHCHILIHEDRGMMQLVQVVPNTTIHTHR
jgi:FtsP/CotA-like multicopper oxidase with cupredoxin domain